MRHDPQSLIWGSPLWMLHALCGTVELSRVGTEVVREIKTERLALKIDVQHAQCCNHVVLGLPALKVAQFSARAWVDADGWVRRVSGMWPSRAGIFRRGHAEIWVQTEFWDFGVSVDHLERPGGYSEVPE